LFFELIVERCVCSIPYLFQTKRKAKKRDFIKNFLDKIDLTLLQPEKSKFPQLSPAKSSTLVVKASGIL